ncbi:MAG: alanine--tRNA ligase-related protein, partial [Bellilinea sp.]
RTVEQGMEHLEEMLAEVKKSGRVVLEGEKAFDLYATHGLPLELTRDVAREQFLDVDQGGFTRAMEEHRLASGAGKAFGVMGGDQVDVYRAIAQDLKTRGTLGAGGVAYDPYSTLEVEGQVLAIVRNGEPIKEAITGDLVEVVLPATCFYIESGGQISDTGTIVSANEPRWEIRVDEMRKPAAGMIAHIGEVVRGKPAVGDVAIASVDAQRRWDIMRNHTATHLLHAELHHVLGKHARQAGSLVAPDRLRFDFTHPEALTMEQLEQIEAGVNRDILDNFRLRVVQKPLAQAMEEGAMALFGEKYGETVRTITIGGEETLSYELCGGTHVDSTGDIGIFLITSEGSAAAGVRRIEAVTGREAYRLVQRRFKLMKLTANVLVSNVDEVSFKAESLVSEVSNLHREISKLRQALATAEFEPSLVNAREVDGVRVLSAVINQADADTLRLLTDRFRQRYPSGVVVLGSALEERPMVIAAITDDLVKQGWNAGELVKVVAAVIGGSGGGRPNLAQAGGKDASKLNEAMDQVLPWVDKKFGK